MISKLLAWLVGEPFLRWLGKFAEDGSNGNPSAKRYAHIAAATVLCLCAITLTFVIGGTPDPMAPVWALGVVCVTLTVLAGFGYVLGKLVEKMPHKDKPNDP